MVLGLCLSENPPFGCGIRSYNLMILSGLIKLMPTSRYFNLAPILGTNINSELAPMWWYGRITVGHLFSEFA